MKTISVPGNSTGQARRMARYYRRQAGIYDATRWCFLFGRNQLMRQFPDDFAPRRILEVGCGTGHNLIALQRRFPMAEITGLDVSEAMLAKARRKLGKRSASIVLRHDSFRPEPDHPAYDLIVFSYCLSMINPGWQEMLATARLHLSDIGRIAVVDFHDTPLPPFRRWMAMNHVRMDGHLLPALKAAFPVEHCEIRHAYAGGWRHFLFVGRPAQL